MTIHDPTPREVCHSLVLQVLTAQHTPGPGVVVTFITRPMWNVWCKAFTTRRFRNNNGHITSIEPDGEGAVAHTRTLIIETDAFACMSRLIPPPPENPPFTPAP